MKRVGTQQKQGKENYDNDNNDAPFWCHRRTDAGELGV